jgi:quercetin 2,3-dioxygenase
MTPPRYQSIVRSQIPAVRLPDGQGVVRVIAGEFAGAKGPAQTCTPMHVWDLRLTSDQRMDLAVSDGYTTALVVLKGALRVNGSEPVGAAEARPVQPRRGEPVHRLCARRDGASAVWPAD